jgi:hypothetical protein
MATLLTNAGQLKDAELKMKLAADMEINSTDRVNHFLTVSV